MGMTIGQGLAQGAQNYFAVQEMERRRKWEDEERARQRREWTNEDETMAQLSNVGKTREMGPVPAENWQDPPIAQSATVDPNIRRSALMQQRADVLAGSKSPKYAMAGIGMEPQVQQAKELEYQQDERTAANAIVKQHSDMRDALLETWNGVEQGVIAPSVFLGTLAKAVPFQKANSLLIAGVPGSEQYMVTDASGKGQFAPITKDAARKIFEQADEYLRTRMENALRGTSAQQYFASEKRGLERQQVGAAVTSAEASKTTAAAAMKKAETDAQMFGPDKALKEALAGKYIAEAEYARAGKGSVNDAREAEAEKKRAILAATVDLEKYQGILVQGKTPDGQPLSPEGRVAYQQAAENAMQRILALQGREQRTNPNEAAFWKSLETNPPATMADLESRRNMFGLGPTIRPGAQPPRGGKQSDKPSATGVAPPAGIGAAEFDVMLRDAERNGAVGKTRLRQWAEQNELSIGQKQRARPYL